MRLIDRDRLIDILTDADATGFAGNCEGCTDIDCLNCIIDDVIETAPTIEAEPVRHGKWILSEEKIDAFTKILTLKCSECGYWRRRSHGLFDRTNYCPNCGAKMDGGDEE